MLCTYLDHFLTKIYLIEIYADAHACAYVHMHTPTDAYAHECAHMCRLSLHDLLCHECCHRCARPSSCLLEYEEYIEIRADRVVHVAVRSRLNRQITDVNGHYVLFIKIKMLDKRDCKVKCHVLYGPDKIFWIIHAFSPHMLAQIMCAF